MKLIAYDLGGYRFEPFNARLLRGDDVIPLTAKAIDTLSVLVQQAGVLVSKEDLMAAVWPGTAVEENNLNQQISALRKALSQGDDSVSIETVPRRGYRLVGTVRRIEVGANGTADSPTASAPPLRRRRLGVVAAAAVLAVTVVAGINSEWFQRRAGAGGESREAAARRRSVDAVARGNELRRAGNATGAVAEMQQAIQLDPTNAHAYSNLAHALNEMTRGGSSSAVRPIGQSPSVQAARRAVEFDPQCGQCLGTLGLFVFYHDWQFKEAEGALLEAIRLAPESEGIRPAYAMLLAVTGRSAEAVKQVDIGLVREPFSSAGWRSELRRSTSGASTRRRSRRPTGRLRFGTRTRVPGPGGAKRSSNSAEAGRRCTHSRSMCSRLSRLSWTRPCARAASTAACARPSS